VAVDVASVARAVSGAGFSTPNTFTARGVPRHSDGIPRHSVPACDCLTRYLRARDALALRVGDARDPSRKNVGDGA
jgi:hypothetical protein